MSLGIPDMDDVESSLMSFRVADSSDPACVLSSRDHDEVAAFQPEELADFVGGQVELDGVVDSDVGVRVADRAAVVRNEVRHVVRRHQSALHLAKLVLRLFCVDRVQQETTLDVVQQAIVLVRRMNRQHVLEARRERGICARLAVHTHVSALLFHDHRRLALRQGHLQAVPQTNHQGKAFTTLVRTGGGSWSPSSTHLPEHPVVRSVHPFKMFLRTPCHCFFIWTTFLMDLEGRQRQDKGKEKKNIGRNLRKEIKEEEKKD
jgi:hypothetical protein